MNLIKRFKELTAFLFIIPTIVLGFPLESEITPEQGYIGDTFLLNINVKPSASQSILEYQYDLAEDNFDIIDKQTSNPGGGIQETYTLISFNTGRLSPGEVNLVLLNSTDGSTEPFKITLQDINIKSVLQDKADTINIYPEREPVAINKSYKYFMKMIFFISGIILLILIMVILIKKYASKFIKKVKKEIIDPRTAYEMALDRLEEIRKKDYIGSGLIKEYYIEVLNVLRIYLSEVSGRGLLSDTMEEAMGVFRDIVLNNEFTEIKDIYFEAWMVKFAKYYPEKDNIKSFIDRVEDWIKSYYKRTKEESQNAVSSKRI
ncbi:MAG: hypothetical protein AB1765_01875 [Candidatus Hydrogenedentota bacterium]